MKVSFSVPRFAALWIALVLPASLWAQAPPTLSKVFGAPSIPLNGSTTLTFILANPNSGTTLDGINFTDSLPVGLVISTPNGLGGTCSGSITATAGSRYLSLWDVTLLHNASCTLIVNVKGTSLGTKNNITSLVDWDGPTPGDPATATLLVLRPPTISKAFGADNILVGASTSLTFTITNLNPSAPLNGVAFTDTLPAGLLIATPSGLASTCGGTPTATAGSNSASLTAGTLAANASCTFAVNVTATTSGTKNNITRAVTSTDGGTGNWATAGVTVAVSPPTISKAFGAANVAVGGGTSLSFTITNPNPSAPLSGVAFTDTLPAGLVIATPNGLTGTCGGGAITATAASGSASLTGATLAASATCTFSVNVTATTTGTKTNTTSTVGSTEGGVGGVATASLVAQQAAAIPALSPAALAGLALLLAGLGWGFTSRQAQRSRPNV
jgi:uncharacterized repeat protein (TIGR01451 family)